MIDEIQHRLEQKVFTPFTIVTSSGERYRVASRDHVGFGPRKSRVLVWFDDDTTALIAGLHIVSIEEGEAPFHPVRPGSAAA